MASSNVNEMIESVLTALENLNLKPSPIPHGKIEELRGGIQSFDLLKGGDVDAAILLSTIGVRSLSKYESEALYRVDYAVRGTIKGILPNRILSRTRFNLKGLFKKRIVGLEWETPFEEKVTESYISIRDEGLPPTSGEVYDGCPYQKFTEELNENKNLMEIIEMFMTSLKGPLLRISIFSDRWRESIRIHGNRWLKKDKLISVYAADDYFELIKIICKHIKSIRRNFGGLTF